MRLIHLFNWYEADKPTQRRIDVAQASWKAAYDANEITPCGHCTVARSSKDIGDTKRVPYLHDVWDFGIVYSCDAVVYSNLDVGIFPGALDAVKSVLESLPCCYSHRKDFKRLDAPPKNPGEGVLYPGADLFAFTPDWWRRVRESIPDVFIAMEGWDHVIKRTMERSGFSSEMLPPVVYHEMHEAYWKKKIGQSPAQLHNRALCRKWAMDNGCSADLDRHPPYLF